VKAPHLLRIAGGPERFAALLAAMSAAGLRAGWLELRRPESPPMAAPASLETAVALGARRAVAAGGGRSLAWKQLRGEPVLRDLLREHFLGCTLVLVSGDHPGPAPLAALPALSPAGDGWEVAFPGGDAAAQHFDTPGLLDALRRPRPWGKVDPARP
jgi:hypothetical protein